jgi:FkbM family methyltransferase
MHAADAHANDSPRILADRQNETVMGTELALIRAIGRCLPPIPHATAVINRLFKPIYLRRPREPVVAEAWGLKMRLNPAEAVDGGILFYPQLFNRVEFGWLGQHMRRADTFLDVGAHIGAFSLRAARLCSNVIAIEANPAMFETLRENIAMNDLPIRAINIGVSDRYESLPLYLQTRNNFGASSFVTNHGKDSITVECRPLAEVAPHADVMKIDIEGMEYKALHPYFEVCKPRVIIMEAPDETDALRLCRSVGYRLEARTVENVLLVRS